MFVDDFAGTLTTYFEETVRTLKDKDKGIRLTLNYMLTDYAGLLKKNIPSGSLTSWTDRLKTISPAHFAELIDMVSSGDVSSSGAKKILALLLIEKESPKTLADKHGLIQKSDAASIEPAIDKVIADNAKVVAEYKAGKESSIQFLIGQAMKATKGAANPAVIKELLVKKLK
jgi:aspartyl-tRNA(Asn)/glutamyl-tRNA(Gln) amidotransferase subunit B